MQLFFVLPNRVLARMGDRSTAYFDLQWDFAAEFAQLMSGLQRTLRAVRGGVSVIVRRADEDRALALITYLHGFDIPCQIAAE